MIALTNASIRQFTVNPVAAATGSQARAGEPEVVHGAVPKATSISLKDAERLIRETAEKLWRGSASAMASLIQMLLNFFRWITRPFRTPASSDAVGSAGAPRLRAASDPNNVMSPVGSGSSDDAPLTDTAIPDDHLGDDRLDTADSFGDAESTSPVSVPKLSFPKPAGPLPVDADTLQGTLARLQTRQPEAEAADPQEMPITTTVCFLEELVSKIVHAQAEVRVLEGQIQTQLVALAALGDTPADQLLGQVLASTDAGGLQGAEIRRLDAERSAHVAKAAEWQGAIENALLTCRFQGLDVEGIAARANVVEVLPDWSARLDRVAPPEPSAPTQEERKQMAIEVEPDVEGAPAGPSAERIARLKATLISSNSPTEHEQERPRG